MGVEVDGTSDKGVDEDAATVEDSDVEVGEEEEGEGTVIEELDASELVGRTSVVAAVVDVPSPSTATVGVRLASGESGSCSDCRGRAEVTGSAGASSSSEESSESKASSTPAGTPPSYQRATAAWTFLPVWRRAAMASPREHPVNSMTWLAASWKSRRMAACWALRMALRLFLAVSTRRRTCSGSRWVAWSMAKRKGDCPKLMRTLTLMAVGRMLKAGSRSEVPEMSWKAGPRSTPFLEKEITPRSRFQKPPTMSPTEKLGTSVSSLPCSTEMGYTRSSSLLLFRMPLRSNEKNESPRHPSFSGQQNPMHSLSLRPSSSTSSSKYANRDRKSV